MFKHLMISAGAVLAAGAANAADFDYPPAIESPVYQPVSMVTGHVEIMGGIVTYEGNTFGAVQGAGRASTPLGSLLKLELEVTGGSLFDNGESSNSFAGIAHVYGEGPNHALGIFGGYVSLFGYSGATIGAEGLYSFGSSVLWGQLAYVSNESLDGLVQVRGGLHHYFGMDTRGTIDLQYVTSPSFDSAWSATGSVEHRFTGTPWSLFGSLGVSGAANTDMRPVTAMVGARLFVDQPGSTLASHDKAVPWTVRIPPIPQQN